MAKGIKRKLRFVREQINRELLAEYQTLSSSGRGMQREGYAGGYLQALTDVEQAMNGFADCNNSRYGRYWDDNA